MRRCKMSNLTQQQTGTFTLKRETEQEEQKGQKVDRSTTSVTRLADLLDFGQFFKAFGNN